MTPRTGLVLERAGASYRVLAEGQEWRAVLRGKAKRDAPKVVAGDVVTLEPEPQGELLGITGVSARRNVVERREPHGRGARPVVANVDRVFVVTATRDPEPVRSIVDRMLVLAEVNDLPVALVVNKIDLDRGEALVAHYRAAGYEVLPVSVRTGEGLDLIRAWLPGHASVVTGPSGVGKSSLLNALQPGLALRTGEVSERIRRGTQTTVSARMVPLAGGGWLVDTPGFSEVGLWGLEPRGLAQCFPEMRPLLGRCRFPDCSHRHEPGCAVTAAVGEGAIAAERLASYRMLVEEIVGEKRDWE
ncbi:MAG: ribosome small subunit-dependent GTPase A [Gemmatimonadales bacterium]|nr:ribosome small subunit-dependent GTPase A [Gemmatimonadales bacterium]